MLWSLALTYFSDFLPGFSFLLFKLCCVYLVYKQCLIHQLSLPTPSLSYTSISNYDAVTFHHPGWSLTLSLLFISPTSQLTNCQISQIFLLYFLFPLPSLTWTQAFLISCLEHYNCLHLPAFRKVRACIHSAPLSQANFPKALLGHFDIPLWGLWAPCRISSSLPFKIFQCRTLTLALVYP